MCKYVIHQNDWCLYLKYRSILAVWLIPNSKIIHQTCFYFGNMRLIMEMECKFLAAECLNTILLVTIFWCFLLFYYSIQLNYVLYSIQLNYDYYVLYLLLLYYPPKNGRKSRPSFEIQHWSWLLSILLTQCHVRM